TLAVRPEKVELEPLGAEGADAAPDAAPGERMLLDGRVIDVHYLGTDARYLIQLEGFTLVARVQNQHHGFAGMLQHGTPVRLARRAGRASLLACAARGGARGTTMSA